MVDLNKLGSSLSKKLPELEGKKVMIFGDIGVDEYVSGDVARISPEAPVPVVEVKSTQEKLGLSGNVAANVKSLGGEPLLFSLVGQDTKAELIRTLLEKKGISANHLITDSNRETTTKLRVMAGHHHVVRVDYESRKDMDAKTLADNEDRIRDGVEQSDLVIIQDYAKGMVSEVSSQSIIHLSKKLGKQVIVDPYRSTPLSYYRGATLMTPNRDEAFELAKQIPKPEIWKNVDEIGRELAEKIDSETMVITLGAEGVKVFEQNEVSRLPTFARKVFDVTGAGDTVIAAFALGMAAKWDLQTTAFFANMAAGVVVGQVGAVSCSISDLETYLNDRSPIGTNT